MGGLLFFVVLVLAGVALVAYALSNQGKNVEPLGQLLDAGTVRVQKGGGVGRYLAASFRRPQPGSVSDVRLGIVVEGVFHGRHAEIFENTRYVGAQSAGDRILRKGQLDLILRLSCSSPLSFEAVRLPQLGLLNEAWRAFYGRVPSGDSGFDQEVGLTSSDTGRLQTWIAQPQNRESLIRVIPARTVISFSRLQVTREWIALALPLSLFRPTADVVRPFLDELDHFAAALERSATS